MKVVMTLLVRDEEDVLESNLHFHLATGVDHFVVTDHKSALVSAVGYPVDAVGHLVDEITARWDLRSSRTVGNGGYRLEVGDRLRHI